MEGNIQPVNNADGWNGKHPIFKQIIDDIKPSIIVEVGSWKGQSTITMAQLAPNSRIYAIDTWLGALEFYTEPTKERDLEKKDGYPQVYYTFLNNLKTHGIINVEPIPLPSTLGLKYLKYIGVKPDIIYIDASHEYEDVKRDIELALELNPKLIFGDDYTNQVFTGVKQAVDELLPNKEIVDNWFWVYRT